MSDEALSVLHDIWRAREQSAADLDATLGHGKTCKAMKHVGFGAGFGGDAEPVDDDLRAAWRSKLEREGKLRSDRQSMRDLLSSRDAPRS
ncbi:hypothetical protein [Actinophytocola sp.]|uniref:hypothetical protein n=1 Tax=Actinophytocola sp. TaxID=1872138 RepID=UPI0025C24324|nr:hypothetical protein [Actinophytocola sp.]